MTNSPTNPVPVQVVTSAPVGKPFNKWVQVADNSNNGGTTPLLAITSGRLQIDQVIASTSHGATQVEVGYLDVADKAACDTVAPTARFTAVSKFHAALGLSYYSPAVPHTIEPPPAGMTRCIVVMSYARYVQFAVSGATL